MGRTRRNRGKKTTSRKSFCKNLKFEEGIVIKFLEVLNTIKLYHWKTHSYAEHKATDDLHSKVGDNVDKFVEVLLGKCGNRVNLEHIKNISLKDFKNENEFKREMEEFKSFLVNLNLGSSNEMTNSDLYNIRDEILADVNQFLYLMTFK